MMASCLVFVGLMVMATTSCISACPEIVSRSSWGALKPRGTPTLMTISPVPHVIIHHTVTGTCNSASTCAATVRSIQNYHISNNGWNDIGYSYLVGGDGKVYEGRSWNSLGAHSGASYNGRSVGIALIGNFDKSAPPTRMTDAVKQLIACGVKSNKIKSNYKLLGHKQVSSTACPGGVFYNALKKWPQWSIKP